MSPFLIPDTAAIERALDKVLKRDTTANVVAIRSTSRRPWPEAVVREGRRFRIAWCPSELEVREELVKASDVDEGLVIMTPLDGGEFGDDVTARFPRGRLEQSDRWSALRAAFRARDIDHRLQAGAIRWLVDLLLEMAPPDGYAPVAGGVLDLESAWRAGMQDILGLPDGRADVGALLDWSLDPGRLDRFSRLPEEPRSAIASRLGALGGPAATLVAAAAAKGRGADALSVALACGVVFGETNPQPNLCEAAIRLEPMVGGFKVTPEMGRILAEAGRRSLDRLVHDSPGAARTVEARTAAILSEIRAEDAAALSPALGIGLDARISEASAGIRLAVETGLADDAGRAWNLANQASLHDRAKEQRARVERLIMAARLTLWLTLPKQPAWRTIAEAATAYATDGGFVDWARKAIRAGDPIAEVGNAYRALAEVVTKRREQENLAFASLLRDWTIRGADAEDPLPIEDVLAKVLVPLARVTPVLLLVMDGLSFAVWRELAGTVERLGWVQMGPVARRRPVVAAAALPTITHVSRASLLCGKLTSGDQAVEQEGFSNNPGMAAVSRTGRPPKLFHKADLTGGPELGAQVRSAVTDRDQRIVGIVHNAVDAQLAGSDQLEFSWTAEGLRQVAAILQAARDVGRTVIIVADHGHVLDDSTTQCPGGAGDRWRASGSPALEGEINLTGERVLSPAGGKTVVTAWSEKIRYAAKRSGYHGGASPQEVLVPLLILSSGSEIAGWSEIPPAEPLWWSGRVEENATQTSTRPAVPTTQTRRRQAESRQSDLFAHAPALVLNHTNAVSGWLDYLVHSEAYSAQRRLAGRVAPPDDTLRALLRALSEAGGRMSRVRVAQDLGLPAYRTAGLVSAARRVLNLDQAQVLREEGDEVILDQALLRTQFGLGGAL